MEKEGGRPKTRDHQQQAGAGEEDGRKQENRTPAFNHSLKGSSESKSKKLAPRRIRKT